MQQIRQPINGDTVLVSFYKNGKEHFIKGVIIDPINRLSQIVLIKTKDGIIHEIGVLDITGHIVLNNNLKIHE